MTRKKYLNTRVEGRVKPETFAALRDYIRWMNSCVTRRNRTKVCRLVARCCDLHLAEVIEADKAAHLARKAAVTQE